MLSDAIKKLISFITNGELWREVALLGEEILKAVLGGVGADLQAVALQAVTAAEAHGGTGEEKFKLAYDQIVATFKTHIFKEVVLNNAIENAVLALTAKIPSTSWLLPLATTTPTT